MSPTVNATQERWLTKHEIAEELGVSHTKISRIIRVDKLEQRLDRYDGRRRLYNFAVIQHALQVAKPEGVQA